LVNKAIIPVIKGATQRSTVVHPYDCNSAGVDKVHPDGLNMENKLTKKKPAFAVINVTTKRAQGEVERAGLLCFKIEGGIRSTRR